MGKISSSCNRISKDLKMVFSAPNTYLYVTLLFISIAVTFVSYFLNLSSNLFAIMAGLGCGGVASTVVAWLIEIANWRKRKKELQLYRSQFLYNIADCFKNGSSAFIYQSIRLNQIKGVNIKHTWYDWIKFAYQGLDDDSNEILKFIAAFQLLCDNLASQIKMVESQKAYLLDSQILSIKDCEALGLLLDITTFVNNPRLGPDKDPSVFAKICYQLVDGMRKDLDTSPKLRFINEREYESVIGMLYANQIYTIIQKYWEMPGYMLIQ